MSLSRHDIAVVTSPLILHQESAANCNNNSNLFTHFIDDHTTYSQLLLKCYGDEIETT